MTLQAVIFDFDGVIANSEPLHLLAFQQTLLGDGIALSAEEYYERYLGFDDVGAFEAMGRDWGLPWSARDIEALVTRKGVTMQALLHGDSVLFPGAAAFVRACAARVPIAVASGAMRHEIVEILRGAGLDGAFKAIVAAGDTPQSKPSPAPYVLALERLSEAAGIPLDAGRSIAIEDSQWGLASAHSAGLRCVGVTTSYAAHELAGAELVVGGLHELTLGQLEQLVA